MTPPRNLTVLTGNGLSIACNPDLALDKITQEAMTRIEAERPHLAKVLQDIAEKQEGRPADADFEVLVGAFGALGDTIDSLAELAEHLDPADTDIRRALVKSGLFARRTRDFGVATVLEIIADRSVASWDVTAELHEMVKQVLTDFTDRVTFANLNYDAMLLAALLTENEFEICDMGDGRRSGQFRAQDGSTHSVNPLRETPSFPSNRRIRLLSLHGSIAYWTNRKGQGFKLPLRILRDYNPWKQVRDKQTPLRPAVVLANQSDKSKLVSQHPFAPAYQGFLEGLKDSGHWLIIGYSFRDECVNERLADAYEHRRRAGLITEILVVTYGTDLKETVVHGAFDPSRAAGGKVPGLVVNRDGAMAFVESFDWAVFSS
jgi:hypothetical protein